MAPKKQMTQADPQYVWVTDHAGRSYPRPRSHVEAHPNQFARVDDRHPVRGRDGRLLPTKFHKPLAPPVVVEVTENPDTESANKEEEKS